MIKLLAVDMDGTCLDNRSRITDRTMEALERAAASGITVVPTTGRSLSCIPGRIRENLEGKAAEKTRKKAGKGLFRYVITSNGAETLDLVLEKRIFQALIPNERALTLLKESRGKGLGLTAHIDHEYILQGRILSQLGRFVYGKDAKETRCAHSLEQVVSKSGYDVEELQFYFMAPGAHKKAEEILRHYPDLSAAYTGTYAEIFAKTASKGNALAALGKYLGIDQGEIACIGDGENDLSMFEASGLKFAMGNAVPALKKKADHVVPENTRDGVAEAIERYILCCGGNDSVV